MERIGGPTTDAPSVKVVESVPHPYRTLFSAAYRKNTIVSIVFYVCKVIPFFALGTFSSQIMKALGVHNELGAAAVYNIFLLIGAVLGVVVIDRISRRFFLVFTFFLGSALLLALVLVSGLSTVAAIVLFASFALVLSAASNLEYVYPTELFPTKLRGTGIGIAVAGSRVGSAASTFLLPLIVAGFGISTALYTCVIVLVIGGLVCWKWAPETSTMSLSDDEEQIEQGAGQ